MIEFHKRQIEWFKERVGISDYAITWIAFIKGLIIGYLIACYLYIFNFKILKIIFYEINILHLPGHQQLPSSGH